MIGILKRCFEINLEDYENINFGLEINKVVLGTFIAIIVGIVLLNTYRGSIRFMVMQLKRHNATDEESAKTLKELGLDSSRVLKKLLSSQNMLTKTVSRVGAVEYDYETYVKMDKAARREAERVDFDSARFYINADESNRAAFIIERYAVSIPKTLVTCLFFVILCGCIIACMPGILNVLNDLIGKIKG